MIGAAAIVLGACAGTVPASSAIPTLAAASDVATSANPSSSPAGTSPTSSPSAAVASVTPSASTDSWTGDLAKLDESVRRIHPAPFTIHTEAEWTAKLAELRASLPAATPDEQLVQLASLVGLLDTHSYLDWRPGAKFYEVLLYQFSDGIYAIRAADPSLIGARLVSINGVSAEEVTKRLAPLVPHDNESGLLDSVQGLYSSVEYLHGSGIVDDPAKPGYRFQRPAGEVAVVNPGGVELSGWENEFGIVGDLMGEKPEAVARRTEPTWWRTETKSHVFLLAYNDYVDPTEGLAAMKAALDAKEADRVVLDLRYLRGGNGSIAFPLVEGLAAEPRVNKPGGVMVLIGRENVSAGTVIVRMLDEQTSATFMGEATPARADNFLCDCVDVVLPSSGFVVGIPSYTFHTGDKRTEIAPDIPMALTARDFFAGRDPVLAAALTGAAIPRPS
jgi:hypothetical protein